MGKRGNAVAALAREPELGPVPRPIRSAVTWSLLGLVIERPGYGYELCGRYEREYGQSLPVTSESQIYRGLDRLVRHGLVEQVPAHLAEAAGDRQPKPHYRATAQGLSRYADWLAAEVWSSRHRAQALIRGLGSLTEAPELVLAVLDSYEQRCLREQRSARSDYKGAQAPGRSGLISRLLAEDRRLALESLLKWLHYARSEVHKLTATVPDRCHPALTRWPEHGPTRAQRRKDQRSHAVRTS